MHTRRRRPGRLLIAAALLALAVPASAGWWDDAGTAREASLSELREDPDAWRDVPVRLEVVFDGLTRHRNPYFTQFTPLRWTPVRIRVPDAARGSEDARSEDARFERLFIRRGGINDERLRATRRGTGVRLRAVVRDSVSGEPWIEVLGVTRDADPLTPEEGAQVRSADRYLTKQNPVPAERLLRAVLDARPLARSDRAALTRRLGVALHDQRRSQEALDAFRTALALEPDLDAERRAETLARALAAKPAPPPPAAAARAGRAVPERPARLRTPLVMPSAKPGLAPPAGLGPPTRTGAPAPLPVPRRNASTPDAAEEETTPEPPAPLPPPPNLSGPR